MYKGNHIILLIRQHSLLIYFSLLFITVIIYNSNKIEMWYLILIIICVKLGVEYYILSLRVDMNSYAYLMII